MPPPTKDPWDRAAALLAQDGKKQPKTKVSYAQTIGAFKTWLAGRPPTEALAGDWLVAKQGNVSNATLQRHRAALRWLLEKALKVGATDLPSYSIAERLPRPLGEGEVDRILAAIETPLERALLMLLYGAALRIAEALSLRIEDIDWERGYLRVVRKGGGEGAIPAESEVFEALRQVVGTRKRGPVLKDVDGYYGARKLLKAVASRAGVRGVTPHRLRHSAATALFTAGADVYAVQAFLGHKRPTQTEGYIKITPHLLRERLPLLFAKNKNLQ